MTIKTVDLKKLNLDLSNPRIGTFESEHDVIEALLKTEKIFQLAKDIAKKGMTNPLDFIGVFESGTKGHFVVAEGNRRVCALKLLDKPELAGAPDQIKKFQMLKAGTTTRINKVEVRVFPDRESANIWIPLRHLGQQDGRGLKSWDTAQKARYLEELGRSDSPDRIAKYLIEYATTNDLLTDEQLDQVPVTTITRYVSNPVLRNALGLTNAKPPEITVPENLFKEALKHFLLDSIGQEPKVNSRSKKTQIDEYANELHETGVAPAVRNQAPKALNKTNQETTKAEEKPGMAAAEKQTTTGRGQSEKQTRHNRNPYDRKYIVPSEFRIHVKPAGLKVIFDEMRRVDVEQFPIAATMLFRAFLENALKCFLEHHKVSLPAELHAKMNAAKAIIEKTEHNKMPGLKNLGSMAANREFNMSAESLGKVAHGTFTPGKTEILKGWTHIEDVIRVLLEKK